jgi:hypothetical protein
MTEVPDTHVLSTALPPTHVPRQNSQADGDAPIENRGAEHLVMIAVRLLQGSRCPEAVVTGPVPLPWVAILVEGLRAQGEGPRTELPPLERR